MRRLPKSAVASPLLLGHSYGKFSAVSNFASITGKFFKGSIFQRHFGGRDFYKESVSTRIKHLYSAYSGFTKAFATEEALADDPREFAQKYPQNKALRSHVLLLYGFSIRMT